MKNKIRLVIYILFNIVIAISGIVCINKGLYLTEQYNISTDGQ